MLSTQYRQPIDWTVQKLEEADAFLMKAQAHAEFDDETPPGGDFVTALSDDLNTPKAIAILNELLDAAKHGTSVTVAGASAAQQLGANLRLLGVEAKGYEGARSLAEDRVDHAHIEEMIKARNEARKAKNFAEADRIRDELKDMGIQLKDSRDPETGEITTTWEIAR
jgi:cysteinyl-tRNA synthetase